MLEINELQKQWETLERYFEPRNLGRPTEGVDYYICSIPYMDALVDAYNNSSIYYELFPKSCFLALGIDDKGDTFWNACCNEDGCECLVETFSSKKCALGWLCAYNYFPDIEFQNLDDAYRKGLLKDLSDTKM